MTTYLISSATRVGSHYLHRLIESCVMNVQKTHNPLEVVDYPNTVLVMISRQDMFSAIMSSMIWKKTEESYSYTNMNVEPFVVDEPNFDGGYTWQKTYQQRHDFTRPYKEIFKFEFEQILQNNNIVFETLNIQPFRPVKVPPQSPYRYQDLILNLDQCRVWFEEHEREFGSI